MQDHLAHARRTLDALLEALGGGEEVDAFSTPVEVGGEVVEQAKDALQELGTQLRSQEYREMCALNSAMERFLFGAEVCLHMHLVAGGEHAAWRQLAATAARALANLVAETDANRHHVLGTGLPARLVACLEVPEDAGQLSVEESMLLTFAAAAVGNLGCDNRAASTTLLDVGVARALSRLFEADVTSESPYPMRALTASGIGNIATAVEDGWSAFADAGLVQCAMRLFVRASEGNDAVGELHGQVGALLVQVAKKHEERVWLEPEHELVVHFLRTALSPGRIHALIAVSDVAAQDGGADDDLLLFGRDVDALLRTLVGCAPKCADRVLDVAAPLLTATPGGSEWSESWKSRLFVLVAAALDSDDACARMQADMDTTARLLGFEEVTQVRLKFTVAGKLASNPEACEQLLRVPAAFEAALEVLGSDTTEVEHILPLHPVSLFLRSLARTETLRDELVQREIVPAVAAKFAQLTAFLLDESESKTPMNTQQAQVLIEVFLACANLFRFLSTPAAEAGYGEEAAAVAARQVLQDPLLMALVDCHCRQGDVRLKMESARALARALWVSGDAGAVTADSSREEQVRAALQALVDSEFEELKEEGAAAFRVLDE